jgi:hypothetical protein
VAHIALSMSTGSLIVQIIVSLLGIAILCCVAYYISWSKKQDKPQPKPAVKPTTVADAPNAIPTVKAVDAAGS